MKEDAGTDRVNLQLAAALERIEVAGCGIQGKRFGCHRVCEKQLLRRSDTSRRLKLMFANPEQE